MPASGLIPNPDFNLPTVVFSGGTMFILRYLGVPDELWMPVMIFGAMFCGFVAVVTNRHEDGVGFFGKLKRGMRSVMFGLFSCLASFAIVEVFLPIDEIAGEYVAALVFIFVVFGHQLYVLARKRLAGFTGH